MVVKKYFVDPLGYYSKLKPKLVANDRVEFISTFDTRGYPVEVYAITNLNATFIYNGQKLAFIRGSSERIANRARSFLENLSDQEVKLTEISNGR